MIEPEFLAPDVVQFLHDKALREYGGIHGIRSEDLLHSALGRPRDKFAYGDASRLDLCELAAAYAFGIARNHPFNDGNKRTAWSSCVLFLKVNGVELSAEPSKIVDHMVALAAGQLDEAAFGVWLRQVTRRPTAST